MSAPSLPRLFVATTVALVALVAPAAALTSVSPTQVVADTDVTMFVTASHDALDPTTSVSASFTEGFQPLACGAPEGWSCAIDGSRVSWVRGASLAGDQSFSMAVHAPGEPGEGAVTLADVRTSGDSSTNIVPLTVLEPEPTPEPTETATATTEPEPTAAPSRTPTGSATTLEPFRPPSGGVDDDPISIRDLPSDAAVDSGLADPAAARIIASSPLTATTILASIIAGLLALSALGFFVARTNR